MKKLKNLQLGLQLDFSITLNICTFMYFYNVNVIKQVAPITSYATCIWKCKFIKNTFSFM
jgi:hypothetical protein